MATLQKVNLGTPPTAVDGDTVRGANTKANANVDVLNAQAALTSAAATITTAQALTAAHVGKRVNISLAAAGTINVPSAATMGLDGVVHLRNVGTTLVTLAVAAGSGDTIALTKLRAGEAVDLDSDGVHAIGCLLRGRSSADDEVVAGALTVGGVVSATGAISSGGAITAGGTVTTGGTLASPSVQAFTINGTERARIDASGFLHVNETTGWIGAPLSVRATSVGTAWAVSSYGAYQSGGGCYLGRVESPQSGFAGWFFGSTQCGSITTPNGASTSYNTTSDYRLKQNYVPIPEAASALSRIKFYQGEFKSVPGEIAHYVIAHELQEVVPSAVTGEKDAMGDWYAVYRDGYDPTDVLPEDIVGAEQEIVPQAVDYSKLVPLLGAALQEALARIEALEARAAA
ncbi:tail fiber domain-containing protein [Caballeronia sp. LZ032]|uniref:tail fiber domain-containing protein n=1 Tax=Caballeronia sp. LZ032 TaxID=3038565 RepID=UPI00285B6300|nr:tail fiber domain-containing protein [Caballeronia sp. LZ032]MDR5881126.1 tail fiber domain-containing protein [Caballeronia sp. LZ032]